MEIFKNKNNTWIFYVLFLFFSLLFFFIPMKELVLRWFTAGSYYTQGPFVFAMFFWILFSRYKSFDTVSNSMVAGIFFITVSLLTEMFGQFASITTFRYISIYLFILGTILYFLGKTFVYRNILLFFYLLLAIPLPGFILDHATFHLKEAAASISGFFLQLLYPSTILYGTTLYINKHLIEITPACSGLHNIFGMASLLWLLAIFQKRAHIAVLDYLLSIPAALLANIVRILVVSILTVQGYGEYALGVFHEAIGVLVFIVIFILIAHFNDWPDFKADGDTIRTAKHAAPGLQGNRLIPLIIIMSILAIGSWGFYIKTLAAPAGTGHLLSGTLAAETPGWKSRDMKLGDVYNRLLNTDDFLMREYYKNNDPSRKQSVFLYFVHARGDRRPFLHRPDLCLKNEGYNLLEQKIIALPQSGKNVSRMLFSRGSQGLLVYYWYRYRGRELDSYFSLQQAMFIDFGKEADCSMIRLSMIVNPQNVGKEEKLIREFAEKEIPVIFKNTCH
ncbi:MAG: EpsI family protein [Spirochaetes bacterium]|nr:EpsI family protein [Spirochaetota bacterium]